MVPALCNHFCCHNPSHGGKAPSCHHQHHSRQDVRGSTPQNGQNVEDKAQHPEQGGGWAVDQESDPSTKGFIAASAWVGSRVCPELGWRVMSPLVHSLHWWEVTCGGHQGLKLPVDHKALHLRKCAFFSLFHSQEKLCRNVLFLQEKQWEEERWISLENFVLYFYFCCLFFLFVWGFLSLLFCLFLILRKKQTRRGIHKIQL